MTAHSLAKLRLHPFIKIQVYLNIRLIYNVIAKNNMRGIYLEDRPRETDLIVKTRNWMFSRFPGKLAICGAMSIKQ
jgi:hypothetical protein